MAEKQCNLIKNGGGMSKVKVIATANANQTFGQQCSQLYSAYSALSDEDKMKCMVVEMYSPSPYYMYPTSLNGNFFRSGINGVGTIELYGINLSIPKCVYATAPFTGPVDITKQTSSIDYKLIMVD